MTLLLVGEDFDQTVLLIEHLRNKDKNLNLHTAMSESDAISLLAKYRGKVSAIICFMSDSKRNGLELASVVRRLGFSMPFFILTKDRALAQSAALKAGVTRVFHRPVAISELLEEIRKVLGL